jgi:hypothetical protein
MFLLLYVVASVEGDRVPHAADWWLFGRRSHGAILGHPGVLHCLLHREGAPSHRTFTRTHIIHFATLSALQVLIFL